MTRFTGEAERLSFSRLVDRIHHDTDQPLSVARRVVQAADIAPWQAELRDTFRRLLGIDDLVASRGPTRVEEGDPDDAPLVHGATIEYIYIESWLGSWIPAYVIKTKDAGDKPLPAVLCLHGHAENKDSVAGAWDRGRNSITAGIDLARRGFLTIAIDHWGFGERGFPWHRGTYDNNEKKFNPNLLLYGRTINGLRVFDAMRAIDYLSTRNDVDANRIGCIGLSLGGTITGWTTAIDPRVQVAVIEGYANTFKASIIDVEHCSCNYVPGILRHADSPDIMALIAPRPQCWVTGEQDTIYPVHGFKNAETTVRRVYDLLGAGEDFTTIIHPRGHEYLGGVDLDFLVDRLSRAPRYP